MSTGGESLAQHPAPHRDRVGTLESMLGLVAGPAGWFLQLCAGYGLASAPCFAEGARRMSGPAANLQWTWAGILTISALGLVLALVGLFLSWRILQRTKDETKGDHHHLLEIGSGRTRFIAMWGVCLSGAFAIVTLLNIVAFLVLPRCAG